MKLNIFEEKEISKYIGYYDFSSFLKNKTLLITGAKGIIGSGIIKWILYMNEHYDLNCHIIGSSRNTVKPEYIDESDNIQYCEFGKEREATKGFLDYIIHAAAPTSNLVFNSNPVESLDVILTGTKSMLELAKSSKAKMLYISSEESYGTPNIDRPIDETYVGGVNSLTIRSCYPLGKKTAELMCKSYFEEYGVDVTIIRPTVILGLWQSYDSVKVEMEILRCIMENKNLHMQSDGSTKKCVIYSLDCISAIFTVLFNGISGEAYNATNPETFCSVKDRAYNAFSKFNSNITIEFAEVDNSTKNGYLPKRQLLEDISKIKRLGWQPMADMNYIYQLDIERFSYSLKK